MDSVAETDAPETRWVDDALPAGHLIGKYELRDAVSGSTAGIVYRAWDRDLGMAVAVKEHRPALLARRNPDGALAAASPSKEAAYAASLRSFIRVSRTLAHCAHPSLVRVLQLQFAHGTVYRVMPWIDGETLRDARRRLPRSPEEAALRALLAELLGALDAIHATGSVHGGVDPSQILLERDGRPVLLGPPTQVAGEAVGVPGPWTDLRALAEVARYWIGGTLYASDRRESTAALVERLTLTDRGSRYGHEFLGVIDAAASPQLSQRPRSAAEFTERLQAAQEADTRPRTEPAFVAEPAFALEPAFVSPPPPSNWVQLHQPHERLARPPIDQRRSAGWMVGSTALLLVALGLGAWYGLEAEPSASAAPVAAALPQAQGPAAPAPALPEARPAALPETPAPAALPPVAAAPAVPPADAAPAVAPTGTAPTAATPPAVTAQAPAPPVEAAAPAPRQPAPTRQPAPGAKIPASASVDSPREVCGSRTRFSLYYCMQQQCARAEWLRHPQCLRFRATDAVD